MTELAEFERSAMLAQFIKSLLDGLEVNQPRARLDHLLREIEINIPGRWDEVWFQRWQQLAPELGLRSIPAVGPLDDLLAGLRPGTVLLLPDAADLNSPGVLVTDYRGNSLAVLEARHGGEPQWQGRSSFLANHVAATAGEQAKGYYLEPSLPCNEPSESDTVAAEHHGHGPHHEHDEHQGIPPGRRILTILRSDRRDIGLIICYALGISVLLLATPIMIEALVTSVAYGSVLQPLVVLSIVLLGCLLFASLLRGLQTFFVEILQRRIFVRVTADLAQRLPRVRISEYDHNHGPELVNRFFDVLTLQKVCAALLMDGVMVVLQIVIGMLVVAFYHPILFVLDLVLLGCIAFIIFGLGRGAVKATIQESIAKYRVAEWLQELARHPITFKMGGGGAFALQRAEVLLADYLQRRSAAFRILFRQIAASLLLQALAGTALLGVGGWLVIQGALTLGQLVAAELILSAVVASFVKFGKHLENFYDLLAATDKLGHLLDLKLEQPGLELHPPPRQPARLRLEHVSFGYHSAADLFENLSLEILPGERVAIDAIDQTGTTTLTELLYGLREPSGGRIMLDEIEYRELRRESLREQVAIVSRNEIFDGTIADNLRMGRESIRDSDLRRVLNQVGLLHDINHFEAGWNTALTTGGAPLSTRQVLRLMLARAILGKPRLLVLDETLDAFARESLLQLKEVLFELHAPWTLVLITKQPEIQRWCERVIALNRSAVSTVPHTAGDQQPERSHPHG